MTGDFAIIDNVNSTLVDDLKEQIRPGDKVAIAASCFSINAYQKLKEQLEQIEEFRFLFTAPTFTAEQTKRELREFYIPRLNRERSLVSDEFEIRLRNELTQRAVAAECADWIRRKAEFRSMKTNDQTSSLITAGKNSWIGTFGFNLVGLGCERGNVALSPISRTQTAEHTLMLFDSLWNNKEKLENVTAEVLETIETLYRENAPEFVCFVAMYNIFKEFLDDATRDVLPDDRTKFKQSKIWNMLYDFQKDAALGIISKLDRYGGCILADSVGLGKTFTALAVMYYYLKRNRNILVLCPRRLEYNWNTFRQNVIGNFLWEDKLHYDVLFHTDLSRTSGYSNGNNLARWQWDNYDLVVIDESHAFRGGIGYNGSDDEKRANRYGQLINKVINGGVQTKVLMLSATPVNNRFQDLRNQLAIAYGGNTVELASRLYGDEPRSVDEIFRQATTVYNEWSKRKDPADRTAVKLVQALSPDFFELLDSVTIARSRRHIRKFYKSAQNAKFPERLKPISLSPALSTVPGAIDYSAIFEALDRLTLAIYTPSHYVFPSCWPKYAEELGETQTTHLNQRNRESGLRRLMATNLLKRLESSSQSFIKTVDRIVGLMSAALKSAEGRRKRTEVAFDYSNAEFIGDDFDQDDQPEAEIALGKRHAISLDDMDVVSWSKDLRHDLEILGDLKSKVGQIKPETDGKLKKLLEIIDDKIAEPINPGNKKVLVFTAFTDTAEYLYEHVQKHVREKHGLNSGLVVGTGPGRSTIPRLPGDMNAVLACFSPKSKDRDTVLPKVSAEIDVLIATDCVSEGQNLQDCDYVVNYDVHWNPVRIIQRFGRIDRLGSENASIQLATFWPDVTLDEYLDLKARLEKKMKIVATTSTADENPISDEDMSEISYRREQLKKLQSEVVDLEEMTGGVSITDLGLNDFKMDLVEYMKRVPEVENAPPGLHAVVAGEKPGVIFVLRNVNESVNIEKRNRLHPYYLVYVGEDGEIVAGCLQPKEILDWLRALTRDKSAPDKKLCARFNRKTGDGKKMDSVAKLLKRAVESIIDAKETSDVESFFRAEQTTFLKNVVRGLDDFELICFLAVLPEERRHA